MNTLWLSIYILVLTSIAFADPYLPLQPKLIPIFKEGARNGECQFPPCSVAPINSYGQWMTFIKDSPDFRADFGPDPVLTIVAHPGAVDVHASNVDIYFRPLSGGEAKEKTLNEKKVNCGSGSAVVGIEYKDNSGFLQRIKKQLPVFEGSNITFNLTDYNGGWVTLKTVIPRNPCQYKFEIKNSIGETGGIYDVYWDEPFRAFRIAGPEVSNLKEKK